MAMGYNTPTTKGNLADCIVPTLHLGNLAEVSIAGEPYLHKTTGNVSLNPQVQVHVVRTTLARAPPVSKNTRVSAHADTHLTSKRQCRIPITHNSII